MDIIMKQWIRLLESIDIREKIGQNTRKNVKKCNFNVEMKNII